MDYTNVTFTEDKLTEQRVITNDILPEAARNYKDTVFRMLFREKSALLIRTSVNSESEYAVEGFVLCCRAVTETCFREEFISQQEYTYSNTAFCCILQWQYTDAGTNGISVV